MADTGRSNADRDALTPLEVVEQWLERAWGHCDLSAVDDLIEEPFIRHNRDGSMTRTRSELRADLCEYQKALGKPIIEVRDRVVDGNRVWSRTTMRGASLQTGETRVVDWIQIHRVEGGRIVEVWTLHALDVAWDS